MKKQTELDNCGFVKTVLMIIIVFYHSILFWSGNWFTENPVYKAEVLTVLAKWLNCFHLYAFTLVSGYIFYFSKHEKGKYKEFVPFLIQKGKRLLVPYLVVGLFWAMPAKLLWQKTGFAITLLGYLSGASPSQLWYLLMLFNVFVLVWPISLWIKNHDFFAGIIAVVLYGVGLVGATFFPNVLQVWNTCKFALFFLIGYKLRQHGTRALMKIPSAIFLLGSLSLFALSQFLSLFNSAAIAVLAECIDLICKIVSAIMIFIFLQKIADKSAVANNRIIKFFEKKTMAIYLLHQQIIYIFIGLFNGIINPYINSAINFFASLILSAIIAGVLMKFKMTRFLIGEK